MAWSFWAISLRVHDGWRESLDRFSRLNDHVQETVAGVRTLRALGLESRASAEFAQRAKAAADSSYEALKWEAAYEPAVGLTLTTATVLTMAVGGWFVWQQQMTVGQLTAFTMYPRPADLADVRHGLGAVADRARPRGVGAVGAGAERAAEHRRSRPHRVGVRRAAGLRGG